ncbi:uncharacterized protein KQ657_000639 [Scheffersomyces spartinae]|uniref:Alkaline phosphatase n=1 Tax=Scheffersomyces spartinae TaxID=45513 RepID=A0A9P7V8W3_9ASCO|nr:uncharacterized protein KQ657_000639 [Scheffersomyces spartinae]KAG7193570.1 hypothetical protein KQ657_000639 [Scheffersomyces spartinae]
MTGSNEDSALLGGIYNSKKKTRTFTWRLLLEVGLVVAIVLAFLCPWKPATGGATSPKVDVNKKKNVIFLVTDGMGPQSVGLARSFRQFRDGLPIDDILTIDKHFIGTSRTRSNNSFVTDSAAGATAFACGLKSYNGAIGVDPEKNPCGTILEALKLQGYMTGLVVTTRLTDATPACFSAHVDYRYQEDMIAQQQIGEYPLGRMVDLMIGGGGCHYNGNCRADGRNLVKEYSDTWNHVSTREEFDLLNEGHNVTLPLLALLSDGELPYEIDRSPKHFPSLAEEAKVALNALAEATKDSDKGFFLMIESSHIDFFGHQNDPAGQAREVLHYDTVFQEVMKFIDSTDVETVAISTSDHETGGLALSRQVSPAYPDYLWYPEVLLNSTHSGEFLAHLLFDYYQSQSSDDTPALTSYITKQVVENLMGITDWTQTDIDRIMTNIMNVNELMYVLNDMISVRAQLGWSTHGHSAIDVNIYAYTNSPAIEEQLKHNGAYDGLSGNHENIEIGRFMESLTGVNLDHVSLLLKKTNHKPEVVKSDFNVNSYHVY